MMLTPIVAEYLAALAEQQVRITARKQARDRNSRSMDVPEIRPYTIAKLDILRTLRGFIKNLRTSKSNEDEDRYFRAEQTCHKRSQGTHGKSCATVLSYSRHRMRATV